MPDGGVHLDRMQFVGGAGRKAVHPGARRRVRSQRSRHEPAGRLGSLVILWK